MIKIRTFTKVYALGKKRKLTLAARILPVYNGEFLEKLQENTAELQITMAIRNPEDKMITGIGKTIAIGRLEHGSKDFVIFQGYYDTLKFPIFLRADTVYAQMDVTAAWIKDNQALFF